MIHPEMFVNSLTTDLVTYNFSLYFISEINWDFIKGSISGLRQILVTESPLKMMKNAFYFILTALLVLKIFVILPWPFWSSRNLVSLQNLRWETFFLKKHIKCDSKTNPRPFSEKLQLIIFLDQLSEHLKICFYCMLKLRTTKIYWN